MSRRPLGVCLGGFMGVGKSTVGQLVATGLSLPFFDLDREVERIAGLSVVDIFARHGEQHFRDLEAAALRERCTEPRCVLALGGGTLHHGDNAAVAGAVFRMYILQAPYRALVDRIARDDGRPLGPRSASLYSERAAVYATVGVQIDALRAPDAVAASIVEHWRTS